MRAFRAKHRLTKAELSRQLQVSPRTIEYWERMRRTSRMVQLALAGLEVELRKGRE